MDDTFFDVLEVLDSASKLSMRDQDLIRNRLLAEILVELRKLRGAVNSLKDETR